MKNLFKSKKGFTLVEIVIVIAIIGLLMIILIPSAINAFKNNQLQGAKIKAQRVAASLEAGIGSGKVPLTVNNAKALDLSSETLITSDAVKDKENPVNIETIAGIKNLYNLPSNNADLLDPLGTSKDSDSNFRVYYVSGVEDADAENEHGVVFITNSLTAATKEDTGVVVYANTADAENPEYK